MINNNLRLCMYCMSPIEEGESKCPSCGNSLDMPDEENYLPKGYIYNNRFIFGRLLKSTGEDACYIGYDKAQECRVMIKEFIPISLAVRNEITQEIMARSGCEVKFKALRSDFKELAIELMEAELEGTIPIVSVFEANNTVYTVYKFLNTISFSKYLQHKSGDISWAETKKLIMPLINTVSALHEQGIIHRGISPETLLVDANQNVYLTSFMSASARSTGGEIPCELYDGYSAPEQYERDGWQDKGTDVYSICAVIYKAVTGAQPIDVYALNRGEKQVPASQITFRVPDYISQTLEDGMKVDIKKRIFSATQLTRLFLQEEQSDTAVFTRQIPILTKSNIENLDEKNYIKPQNEIGKTQAISMPKPQKGKTLKRVIVSALITIIIFGLGAIAVYLIHNNKQEEKEKYLISEAPEIKSLQNFVGEKYNMLIADEKISDWYNFSVTEIYSDTISKGTVISQFPEEGIPMMEGRKVLLTVSKGSDKIEMPDLLDMDIKEAVRYTALMGCEVDFVFVEDEEEKTDIVLKTEPESGTKFNPKTQRITLYLSSESDFKDEIIQPQENAEE